MLGNSRKRPMVVFTQSTLDSQLSSENDITSRFISSSFQPSPPPSYIMPSTLNTNQYSESEEIAARSLSRPTNESQCCAGWCNNAKKPIKKNKTKPPNSLRRRSTRKRITRTLYRPCVQHGQHQLNISSPHEGKCLQHTHPHHTI